MKFLLIKWLTKASSLWMLDLAQWKQVVSIARLVAKDHELELVNIGLVEQDLEVFLFGNQHKINTFIKEFRFELYCYLQTIDKEYSHKALSSLHLIEEIEESDSRLIEAVKTGLLTSKIYGLLSSQNEAGSKLSNKVNRSPIKPLPPPQS